MANNRDKLEPLMVPYEGAKEEKNKSGVNVSIECKPPRSIFGKIYDFLGIDDVDAKISVKFKK